MDDAEISKLVEQLRERMSDVEPLQHEEFFNRTDTYVQHVLFGNFLLTQ